MASSEGAVSPGSTDARASALVAGVTGCLLPGLCADQP